MASTYTQSGKMPLDAGAPNMDFVKQIWSSIPNEEVDKLSHMRHKPETRPFNSWRQGSGVSDDQNNNKQNSYNNYPGGFYNEDYHYNTSNFTGNVSSGFHNNYDSSNNNMSWRQPFRPHGGNPAPAPSNRNTNLNKTKSTFWQRNSTKVPNKKKSDFGSDCQSWRGLPLSTSTGTNNSLGPRTFSSSCSSLGSNSSLGPKKPQYKYQPIHIPSYVRGRVSDMKAFITENDVEVRLDGSQFSGKAVIWVRRKGCTHPSSAVQKCLAGFRCQSMVDIHNKRTWPVVVMRPGGKKYRAVLESDSINEDGEIAYRDVDSGMSSLVPANSVFRCTKAVLAVPADAWRCQLETSENPKHLSTKKWSAMQIRVIKWSQVPTIRLVSKTGAKDEPDNFPDYSHIFNVDKPLEKPERAQKLYEALPAVELPRGRVALLQDCIVLSVQFPFVYFMPGNAREQLELEEPFIDDAPLEGFAVLDPKPNGLYMIQIENRCHRVVVKAIRDNYATVVFVDCGKLAIVQRSDLLPITPTRRHKRPACIKGRLPDEYLTKFNDELTLSLFTMAGGDMQVVITKYEGDLPVVRLYGADGREISAA